MASGRTIEPKDAPAAPPGEPRYVATGTVYVYRRTASGGWDELPCAMKAPNVDTCDAFGYSVATGNDFIVAGAPTEDGRSAGNDNDLLDSGALYVFTRAVER